MLAHHLRCWPGIKPALVQCLVFAGLRANMLVVTAGSEYKPTPTQCLLNVGPASPVLGSIHSALVSTSWSSCWWYRQNALNESWVNADWMEKMLDRNEWHTQTKRKRQTDWADRGKPTFLYLCERRDIISIITVVFATVLCILIKTQGSNNLQESWCLLDIWRWQWRHLVYSLWSIYM